MTRDSKQGLTELDRVLSAAFPKVYKEERSALGEVDVSTEGLAPGITYQGGPQTQERGQGRAASRAKRQWAKILDGIDLDKCGILANEDCLELVSRMLEQTFRNFMSFSHRPTWIDPPYVASPVNVRPFVGPFVSLMGGGPFAKVCLFKVPQGKKCEIVAAGQGVFNASVPTLDDPATFDDTEWRITVDGIPYAPWELIQGLQIFKFSPPTRLCSPIHLQQGQTITLEARSTAGIIQATGQLCGWVYTPRADTGDEARATIVD